MNKTEKTVTLVLGCQAIVTIHYLYSHCGTKRKPATSLK